VALLSGVAAVAGIARIVPLLPEVSPNKIASRLSINRPASETCHSRVERQNSADTVMEKLSAQWKNLDRGCVRGTSRVGFVPSINFQNTEVLRLGFATTALRCLVVATFALLTAFTLSAANFSATLDRDTISLGESATLKLRFEGAQPQTMLQRRQYAGIFFRQRRFLVQYYHDAFAHADAGW
jgi:hypothetical protein